MNTALARRTVTARGTGGIDTSEFKAAVKALRRAQPQLAKELRKELREAGLIVAEEAKKIIEPHSKKIPRTIKVRVSGASVAVVAGGPNAPTAALFELGNTGGKGSASASRNGVFRHPVFGNREQWVNQPMHPFLAPAALANLPRVDEHVGRALDTVTRTIIFEGL